MNWYTIADIDRIDSPALVVYPDRVKENIALALAMVDGDPSRLRPHVKTHKSPEATRLLLDAGIHKFKCATIAEAEMLAICGAPDVLLAYQPIGPKLQRFIALIKKYPDTKFSCLFDNPSAAAAMEKAFLSNQLRVPVYLDLNLGMNRTGIVPGDDAKQLYKKYERETPYGIHPIGLHAYDGHIRDADFAQRKQKCDIAFAAVEKLRDEIAATVPATAPLIVAGGSPTFSIHCRRKNVECSPGTFIYWDKGYMELCPEQAFKPAALVITRVVSLPDPTKLCLDLGHKSIAAEGELAKRVHFSDTPMPLVALSQSEEHLVVDAGPGHGYQPGDILYGMPAHICPTVALFERAFTIENGMFTGQWKNQARDRQLNI
jgi:D-serine deaminase-like pyridoxal phosphate-dependent protein